MIQDILDKSRQLTIHICSGIVSSEELLDAVKVLYDTGLTPNHLWDMTGADMSAITVETMRKIAELAKSRSSSVVGGRTVLVSSSSLTFGLSRMYEAFAESAGLKSEVRAFSTREEAEKWLIAPPEE